MASLKVKELLCLLYTGLLFISGVLLIGFSVVLCYKVFYHFKFIPTSSIGPFIVFFLLGFVHLFLTWLGVKGPSREHDLHIILFMIITLVLLVTECAVGVWSIILWDEVDVESIKLMAASFDELLDHDFNKKDWFTLETELKCCGFDGPDGYRKKGSVPFSCCDEDSFNSSCKTYTNGCQKPLARYAKVVLIDGAIMGFSCCVFQAIGVFAFFTFLRALRVERAARVQRRLQLQRSASQENGGANPTPSSPPIPA